MSNAGNAKHNYLLLDDFMVHHKALFDAATKILGCRYWAEDVLHDVFIKIKQVINDQAIDHPIRYLHRMVRNLAIDSLRRKKFEQTHFIEEEQAFGVASNIDCPERIAMHRQSLQLIIEAFNQLPTRTKKAFELHRIEGLTQKEVAKIMGVSPTLINFMVKEVNASCAAALTN